jgi:hypothetical protein
MKDITIERSAVNIDALDAELRAALGAATSGYSIGGGKVIVHLLDSATPQQEALARQVVATHDAARLTQQQQQEAERQSRLAQSRRDFGAMEIDLAPYGTQPPTIQQLAQKIAWLEREITDLRHRVV